MPAEFADSVVAAVFVLVVLGSLELVERLVVDLLERHFDCPVGLVAYLEVVGLLAVVALVDLFQQHFVVMGLLAGFVSVLVVLIELCFHLVVGLLVVEFDDSGRSLCRCDRFRRFCFWI